MQDILKLINSKKLLIFDFDGTLSNTSPIHEQAFRDILEPLNIEFIYQDIAGMNSKAAFLKILTENKIFFSDHQMNEMIMRKQTIARSIIKENLCLEPAVKKFLNWAYKNSNFKLCVVSSGSRQTIEISIEKLGLNQYFEFLICSEDVQYAKPNPEGFLKALVQTKLKNDEAIIFEDSQAGFLSAENANISYLNVTGNFWKEISSIL
ncbi:HAD family phosphatase [Gammaproteobacteria bacterium]|nr:HAD family phosphatase [Gammaproteobacteria bacterium]